MRAPVLRVFVSSTSEDLEPYRTAASDVIREQDWHPDMMEYYKAAVPRTLEECQRRVAASDAMVLIVAFRRGWVPSTKEGGDDRQSIVSFEFQAAERAGIPILVFL